MPKMLMLAPCEKAIISTDGPVSLIAILERIEASVPANIALAEHSSIPMRWNVISVWQKIPTDEGRRFEQIFQLLESDGSLALHTPPTEIIVPRDKSRARIIGHITHLPITGGNLTLKLLYREIGTEQWTDEAEYPIEVALTRSEV